MRIHTDLRRLFHKCIRVDPPDLRRSALANEQRFLANEQRFLANKQRFLANELLWLPPYRFVTNPCAANTTASTVIPSSL